ncbi:MAG: BBP7 family outer membrane beta-barrel protein [Pirellulaceae bacterium]
MTMRSGRMHWLSMGLALVVSTQGWMTQDASGQAPMKPGSAAARKQQAVAPASYGEYGAMQHIAPGVSGVMPDAPMSMSFPGPAPMDVTHASHMSGGGSGCDEISCSTCGDCGCGGSGCTLPGVFGGAGCGLKSLFGGSGSGCGMCGGAGCGACGGLSGLGGGLLGRLLGGYSEGGRGQQRWYDIYAGGMALKRTSDVGGFSSSVQNPTTGAFIPQDIISTNGISGTPALRASDLSFDNDFQWGLELVAALQTGVGSHLEARYFGLNNWNESMTASTVQSGNPTLFSIFSDFGVSPANGFDDTDRSFTHTISYNSEIHNGEVNFRRRWVGGGGLTQGSWLFGIRHFDLDERFGFNAVGSSNNTFTFSTLRFFDYFTETRNQLTGVQVGGDFWFNVTPGLHLGIEGKSGLFGNHAEVESTVISNSIPGGTLGEHMQEGQTAYLAEGVAQAVYRLNYSWSFRAAYNVLYVDNVALAPENFNTRDFSNGLGGAFSLARAPYIDVDGEVLYQGFSLGAEWMY